MNQLTEAVVTIAVAVTGVALLALLVSQKSNTAGVLQAAGSAFSNALGVAVSPVSGGGLNINTSYPGGTGGFQMPAMNFNTGLSGGFPY